MERIKEFIKISKYSGMREDLVQAGGGNTSAKLDENKMLIKASGFQLADITLESGYSEINYKQIVDFFNNTPIDEISNDYENQLLNDSLISGTRPSIETFLHSITDTFTLHTHPMLVNVLACRENGMDVLKELFPDALFVDYDTPGIKLAKEYFKTYKENTKEFIKLFNVIFLKNHGLIISAKSAEEVINKTEEVVLKIEKYLNVNMNTYRNSTMLYNEFIKCTNEDKIIYLSNDNNIKNILKEMNAEMLKYWFCPDCLVYCGKRPLILKESFGSYDIQSHIKNYGQPVIIYYDNNIYIRANSIKKAKEIESVLSFSAQVLYLNKDFNVDLLEDEEQNFLLNWDAEKYRQNMK
ncbi:class II aldolase/adducin family protein [Clostridium butyricum]|uniref:class II aldolase/adducin family protein n=1 Tax=Clostridium butyricum TaxID=1492 RepID=UPI00374F7C45